MDKRTFLQGAASAAAASAASVAAPWVHAQAWPARPIKYLVPFPPGGATDILARIVAEKLTSALGQPVIVENRAGAAGNVGTEAVVKSPNDGYTVMQGTVANSISETLYTKLPFSFERDLQPVALVALVPNVLVVHPSVPARSVKELVDLLRAKPGTYNYASSGTGTSIHMSGELFKLLAKVEATHIPYKGSAPALQDLVGGQVSLMFDNLPPALPHIKSGRLRALAITTAKRSPALPDLPTMQEAGIAGYDASAWFGMLAPKGTPMEIVNRLNSEINKFIASPEGREKIALQGGEPAPMNPTEFSAFIKNEITKWSRVVKASGAKAD
jgi:tripartite-type tricarboxylate transporter receptor subunit TctC